MKKMLQGAFGAALAWAGAVKAEEDSEEGRLRFVLDDPQPWINESVICEPFYGPLKSRPILDDGLIHLCFWSWENGRLTFHIDGTSPANGFLRVVPGSHRHGWDDVPGGFGKIDGEVAVYCEPGDVLLHHSDLWHSAARATEEWPGGIRRHMRGSFMGGRRLGPGERLEPFNRNADR